MLPPQYGIPNSFQKEKWIELLSEISKQKVIYLLGAPTDSILCEEIIQKSGNTNCISLCGKISLLQSALLMKHAEMNFVNDSAPLHLASSQNAPVRTFFLSTVPEFGFGPLSDNSKVIQVTNLNCRPCGLHGHRQCPQSHFNCAHKINIHNALD